MFLKCTFHVQVYKDSDRAVILTQVTHTSVVGHQITAALASNGSTAGSSGSSGSIVYSSDLAGMASQLQDAQDKADKAYKIAVSDIQ